MDSNALNITEIDDSQKSKHSVDFEKVITDTQSRILMIWRETSLRHPREMFKEYISRWPNHYLSDLSFFASLRDLKKKALAFDRRYLREQLLSEYEILFQEAYGAWLDSKNDQVTYIEKKEETDKGFKETATERRTPQVGNPAHWKNAASVLEAMRQMVGADEPKKIETIIKREFDLFLQYMETGLSKDAFGEVMNLLIQYDAERGE